MNNEKYLLNFLAELTIKLEDLEEENKKLEKLAYEDALTNLKNRAYYEEWKSSLTINCYPLNIISIDCNGLKQINDNYGHSVGDEYIITAARMLKNVFPSNAIICRIGGDEFVVALGGSITEINSFIEKIRTLSGKITISNGEPVSLSVGAAHAEKYVKRIDNLFEEADKMMYQEKRAYYKVKKLAAS